MCNNFQEQTDQVLTIWLSAQDTLTIKLAYLTNDGNIIIQGKTEFEQKQNYENKQRLSKENKMKDLLSQRTTGELRSLGKKLLSKALHYVAPTVKAYGNGQEDVETDFIKEAIFEIDTLTSNSDYFINMLAEIIVYLTDLDTDVFKQLIIAEYYSPQMLVRLTSEEKFPEVLQDSKKYKAEETFYNINIKLEKIKKRIQNFYYKIMFIDPTARTSSLPTPTGQQDKFAKLTSPHSVDGLKSAWICENYLDMLNVPESQIIYYYDNVDSKTYCLLIDNIRFQIVTTETAVNPTHR